MSSENNSSVKPKNRHGNFLYDFVKITGAIPAWLMIRPKIYRINKAKNPKGAFMVTANHPSPCDPITLLVSFPTRRLHCLATIELFKTKLGSWFFERMHIIPVDKENFNPLIFRDIQDRLADGHPVVIFPEGRLTTQNDGAIQAFKSGAVLMAYKSGVSILPVYLRKRDKWYQRQRIVIGEPINVTELIGKLPTKSAITSTSEVVRERELELQNYFESLPIGKKLLRKKAKLQAKAEKKAIKKSNKSASDKTSSPTSE